MFKDLYIPEVCTESLGGEEIHLCFRVLPGVLGQARFVSAAIRKELLFGPTGLIGDLRQKAT